METGSGQNAGGRYELSFRCVGASLIISRREEEHDLRNNYDVITGGERTQRFCLGQGDSSLLPLEVAVVS
jgi:hypothetical protein